MFLITNIYERHFLFLPKPDVAASLKNTILGSFNIKLTFTIYLFI